MGEAHAGEVKAAVGSGAKVLQGEDRTVVACPVDHVPNVATLRQSASGSRQTRLTIAADVGVPLDSAWMARRGTGRRSQSGACRLIETELGPEILKLRRRVEKLVRRHHPGGCLCPYGAVLMW